MNAGECFSVKVSLEGNNELRRFKLQEPPTFGGLCSGIRGVFSLGAAAQLTVCYRDEEGDVITMSSDDELAEALRTVAKNRILRVEAKISAVLPAAPSAPSSIVAPAGSPLGVPAQAAVSAAPPLSARAAMKLERQAQRDQLKLQRHVERAARKASRHAEKEQDDSGGRRGMAKELDCRFVKDVTIEDGSEVAAGSRFAKIWRLRNSGVQGWPAGCNLVFVGRDDKDRLSGPALVPVAAAAAGEEVDVEVAFVAPEQAGRYIGYWKMATPTGRKFGQRVWVNIVVPSPSDDEHPSPVIDAKIDPVELWSMQVKHLTEMGFDGVDPALMVRLLEKHQGNLSKVALALIKKQATRAQTKSAM